MMTKTGMLVVTNPNKFVRHIPRLQKEIKSTLYIQFLTKCQRSYLNNSSLSYSRNSGTMFSSSVLSLYRTSLNMNNVDVRVLLGNLKNSNLSQITTKNPIEIVYFDDLFNKDDMQGFIARCITNVSSNCITISLDEQEECDNNDDKVDTANELFENVVLGGTFDRLHAGHKILLSEAVLRCSKKLTVGVTNTEMLKTKKLWELIEPCDTRMQNVKDFLEDVEPCLEYNIVPIGDMFGPTKDDPSFQMLVVSNETVRGGAKVNEVRMKNGLKPLVVHCVELLCNPKQEEEEEEDKISSSNDRLRLLGILLRPPEDRNHLPRWPYIIGLTGGIASGKSSICKRLVALGAAHINCDVVAHDIYKKGTKSYQLILDTFGSSILDEHSEISRKSLAKSVFNDESARNKLNAILWPNILEKSKEMAFDYFHKMGKKIIILEAAVLVEAGWVQHCHEVWACIVPPEEAIKRLSERGLNKEDALARIKAQPVNKQYVEDANLVFCTLWRPQFTQKQVERAWVGLNERLE